MHTVPYLAECWEGTSFDLNRKAYVSLSLFPLFANFTDPPHHIRPRFSVFLYSRLRSFHHLEHPERRPPCSSGSANSNMLPTFPSKEKINMMSLYSRITVFHIPQIEERWALRMDIVMTRIQLCNLKYLLVTSLSVCFLELLITCDYLLYADITTHLEGNSYSPSRSRNLPAKDFSLSEGLLFFANRFPK